MERTRPGTLAAVATVALVATVLVLRWLQGEGVIVARVPIVIVLLSAFAVIVAVLGWRVRRFVAGIVSMEPVAAARVAALAMTAAYVGAIGVGVGLGQVGAVIDQVGAPAARADALVGGGTAVAGLVCVIAGLLAQLWCRVPDDDDRDRDRDGRRDPRDGPAPS